MAGRVFIGTSGYAYPHWRGLFYPERLAQREWLRFYAGCFATVELNNPFYRLPEAKTFRAWRDAVPKGFVCAVKASRYITHIKRLKDPEEPLGTFLARARLLEHALGPVLFQLPGNFHADLLRLDHFLDALARQRFVQGLRAVLEVRHPSWLERQATDRLATAGVALCLADWAECPVEGPVTADFVYVRRHGTSVRYGGSYPTRRLKEDARQIGGWLREGRDVYVYFNNDEAAFAVQDSRRLLELVGQSEGARVPTPEAWVSPSETSPRNGGSSRGAADEPQAW